MFIGINSNRGQVIEDNEAFEYAKEHIDDLKGNERIEFVKFFFSGDYVWEEEEHGNRKVDGYSD